MLREAILSLVLALGALALLPAAPAQPAACDALAGAEESLQNDAGYVGDAPDEPGDALRVHADGYYFGYLSAARYANADGEDWYVYAVPQGTERMRANVTEAFPVIPTYTADLPTYLQSFTLTLWPPDGSAPREILSTQGTLVLPDPVPGDYLVRVTATPLVDASACPAGMAPPFVTELGVPARNHGMYLGCDPLCAEGGPMSPADLQASLSL